jgi:hypothetical protein
VLTSLWVRAGIGQPLTAAGRQRSHAELPLLARDATLVNTLRTVRLDSHTSQRMAYSVFDFIVFLPAGCMVSRDFVFDFGWSVVQIACSGSRLNA